LGDRGEDAHAVVGVRFARRQDEGRLREVRPVRDPLHVVGGEPVTVEHDGHRVAPVGRVGEDVDLSEGSSHGGECASRPCPGACENRLMTDEFEDDLDDDLDDDAGDLAEPDLTDFDRTRADYTGVELDDEFQPVDDVELAEEGLELDDPERLAVLSDGADDPDGVDASPRESLDPDDLGWDQDDTG